MTLPLNSNELRVPKALYSWKGEHLKSRIRWLAGIVLFSLCFLIMSVPTYAAGRGIGISGSRYQYIRPAQRLPKIISSQSLGPARIAEIKQYFTDEQTVRGIAGYMGIDFKVLITGVYWRGCRVGSILNLSLKRINTVHLSGGHTLLQLDAGW